MYSTLSHLAICNDLPKISKMIVSKEVTWLVIPTGSGKSVGIPNYLAQQTGDTLICTQPTIPAVTGLYEYQKTLMPKNSVGWAAEGNKKYNNKNTVIYCTAGHFRKLFLSHFKNGKASDMTICKYLMVDEVHTGSKDNSIIIDLWLEAKRQGRIVPNLILSTATDGGMDKLMKKVGGSIFRSTFRHYAVETRYHAKGQKSIDDDMSFTDAAYYAVDLLVETRSHGIVFCSGSGECEDMKDMIESTLSDRNTADLFPRDKIEVLLCFSQCKREEILKAISEAPPHVLRIICATNVAESSITIPNVKWVVDMMSEKRTSMKGGKFHLGAAIISKNSADQRKGRTGRTVRGSICQRMITAEAYAKLEDYRPLEICTSPISDVLIELLDVGLDPCRIITDLSQDRLIAARDILVETECIILKDSVYGELNATITDRGRFVAGIPMDVRNASVLHHLITTNRAGEHFSIFWAMAATVLLDSHGPSLFWFPRKERNESAAMYRSRMTEYAEDNFSEFEGDHPMHTLCNSFFQCMEKYSETNLYTKPYKLASWARDNSMNNKKLKDIISSMRRISSTITRFGYCCEYDEDFTIASLGKMMTPVCESISKMYRSKKLSYTYSFRGDTWTDSQGQPVIVDTIKVVCDSPQLDVVSLSEIRIENPVKKTVTNICSLWIPRQLIKI
jgi:HrpA-like RNA helicase